MRYRFEEQVPPSSTTWLVVALVTAALYLAYRLYRAMPEPPDSGEEEPPPEDYASPFAPDPEPEKTSDSEI